MATTTNFIGFIPSSDDYNGVNYIKEVSSFENYASFVGEFTLTYSYNSTYDSYRTTTKNLSFNIGSIWENKNGISLIFLNDIK